MVWRVYAAAKAASEGKVNTVTPSGHLITEAGDVLEAAIRHAETRRSQGANPVVVLDIDGTLMDNRSRKLAIIHEFAEQIVGFSWVRRALISLTVAEVRYDFVQTFRDAVRSSPEAEANAEALNTLAAKLDQYWPSKFLTNGYQRHDTPFPGSITFTRQVREAGLNILYLTGRDEPNMREGLLESFKAHGFPTPDTDSGTNLIMKPDPSDNDKEFKYGELEKLVANGVYPVLSIEDNAANASMFVPFCDLSLLFVSSDVSDFSRLHPHARVLRSYYTTAS